MMQTTMIIVWAVLVAATLLFEFLTTDFFACCFSLGGIVALILAACGANLYWQIPVFIVITLVALFGARPFLKKFFLKKTIPTNFDQYLGTTTKLLSDVVDGKSTVKINDVVWTAVCEENLKTGDTVTIEKPVGNKLVVKGAK